MSGCLYLLQAQCCAVSLLSVKPSSVRVRRKQLQPELQQVMEGLKRSIAQPGCRRPDCGTWKRVAQKDRGAP